VTLSRRSETACRSCIPFLCRLAAYLSHRLRNLVLVLVARSFFLCQSWPLTIITMAVVSRLPMAPHPTHRPITKLMMLPHHSRHQRLRTSPTHTTPTTLLTVRFIPPTLPHI
jgi:hypothetical protein